MGMAENIKVDPSTVTWGTLDLGFTQGDLEMSLTAGENYVDVTAHQQGSTVMDQIPTGSAPKEISVVLEEVTTANYEAMIKDAVGGDLTPGGGTEILGHGLSKRFSGIVQYAQKLIFHPITAADATRDIFFWLAVPVEVAEVKSGEGLNVLNVTFRCFPDLTAAKADIAYGNVGDHTQTIP